MFHHGSFHSVYECHMSQRSIFEEISTNYKESGILCLITRPMSALITIFEGSSDENSHAWDFISSQLQKSFSFNNLAQDNCQFIKHVTDHNFLDVFRLHNISLLLHSSSLSHIHELTDSLWRKNMLLIMKVFKFSSDSCPFLQTFHLFNM